MGENCILKNPKENLGYLIWRVTKYWQRGKHKLLDEFDLTASQMEILGAIYHISRDQFEVTQIILSQETDIDPMTTSTILRNLEKKGYITRKESKTDTRARIVEITLQGEELFEKAVIKVNNAQELLFRNIDQQVLKDQLTVLIQELEIINKENN